MTDQRAMELEEAVERLTAKVAYLERWSWKTWALADIIWKRICPDEPLPDLSQGLAQERPRALPKAKTKTKTITKRQCQTDVSRPRRRGKGKVRRKNKDRATDTL